MFSSSQLGRHSGSQFGRNNWGMNSSSSRAQIRLADKGWPLHQQQQQLPPSVQSAIMNINRGEFQPGDGTSIQGEMIYWSESTQFFFRYEYTTPTERENFMGTLAQLISDPHRCYSPGGTVSTVSHYYSTTTTIKRRWKSISFVQS